jgi:hypothetical protein
MYPVKRQISARTPAISGSFAISIQKTGKELPANEIIELGSAITTLTYHPVFPGLPNAHWTALGKKLLRESEKKGSTKG